MTLAELRARAMALHHAGRLAEAERLYVDVLRENPADCHVLHMQGVIAHQTGRHALAVELISRAIALNADVVAFYLSLAAALMSLERQAEALASLDRATALQPECVEAHNNRGIALQLLRRSAEALASFDQALALRPDSADLHNNRGNVLRHLRRLPEALGSYERAIALQPKFAPAYNNRGLVLQALQRYREAADSYERALILQPHSADAYSNLATVQCELGEAGAAVESCRRALQLQPGMRGIHGNLGNALRDLDRPEEALAEYELALREAPEDPDNHCRRGNAQFDLGLIPDAIASYERAIELSPQHARAHFNKGLCLLLAGEFAQGFPLYEWRKQLATTPPPAISAPAWRGEVDISGRTLFVYADQALGDTLQFCRYAQLAEERGARVILAAQPQLRELLTGLRPKLRIVAPGEPTGGFDYHCALMSLPLAFGTTPATVPATVPYLFADGARVARWRERIGTDGFRIGIAWQGSRNRIDVGRSVPLEKFASLAAIPGVRLISLQKDTGPAQLAAAGADLALEVLGEDFDQGPGAFLDSAAVMSHLELIITCDTALAHLAGALGRPTWVALKHVPDWRWLLDRTDSPWYPSLRLFRQSRRGDWDGVFAAIHEELLRLVRARQTHPRL